MKTRTILVVILITAALGPLSIDAQQPRGNPRPNPPDLVPPPIKYRDLVVTEATRTARSKASKDAVNLPFRVRVRNLGNMATGKFKVSVEYTTPDDEGEYQVVQFTVPGNPGTWFPMTNGLGAGGSLVFSGTLKFPPGLNVAQLRVIADSCAEDWGLPNYCRVQEFNENNNSRTGLVAFNK
jgi:hypothetical protein